MAKRSVIERNLKHKKHFAQAKKRRDELRKVCRDRSLTVKERFEAQLKLNSMRRGSCVTKIRNRCEFTGRPRGYMRRFGVCRNFFRELASKGMLPGITKSSW